MFDLSDSLGSVADTTYDETNRILTEYLAPQRNVECEVAGVEREFGHIFYVDGESDCSEMPVKQSTGKGPE